MKNPDSSSLLTPIPSLSETIGYLIFHDLVASSCWGLGRFRCLSLDQKKYKIEVIKSVLLLLSRHLESLLSDMRFRHEQT